MRERALVLLALIAWAFAGAGCARLGFTNRVLWSVPAPDGRYVAVCQEIPEFDGPGFDVRLERPGGGTIVNLYQIGDGDPCSEIAWSPDSRTLAVLSGHVARVRFVDVEWALRNVETRTSHWSWRTVSLSTDRERLLGKNIRFVRDLEVELTTCAYSQAETQRTGTMTCAAGETQKRFRIPTPIMTGRHTASN